MRNEHGRRNPATIRANSEQNPPQWLSHSHIGPAHGWHSHIADVRNGSNPVLGAPSRHVRLAAVSGLYLGVAIGLRSAISRPWTSDAPRVRMGFLSKQTNVGSRA